MGPTVFRSDDHLDSFTKETTMSKLAQLETPLRQFAADDEFVSAYIDCMMWAEVFTTENGDSEDDGKSFEYLNFSADDIDIDSLMGIIDDCGAFERMALVPLYHVYNSTKIDYNRSQAGHDFYLTRNGHGTGFWDRGLPKLDYIDCGAQLTKISKTFGTMGLCASSETIDDDTILYTHS